MDLIYKRMMAPPDKGYENVNKTNPFEANFAFEEFFFPNLQQKSD
jgi:hypothetical protein